MEKDEESLEKMMVRGEILDIGIVEIEEEELEIPVDVDDGIDRSMLPEVDTNFKPRARRLTPLPIEIELNDDNVDRSRLPELVVYVPQKVTNAVPRGYEAESSTHFVKVDDAQRRLRMLSNYMDQEQGLGQKVARLFGAISENDRINAFGDYFAEILGTSNRYMGPAEFIFKAEVALTHLKSGNDGGRPLRKSIRNVFAVKDEKVYDAIRERLPEIARAVATTGFAVELNQLYNDARKAGMTPFEYAKEIRQHQYLNDIERMLLRDGFK